MPDGPPPSGDEEKIIINAGLAAEILTRTCNRIYERIEGGWHPQHAPKLVRLANELEDLAFKFQREFLEQAGFTGPWPKSMDGAVN